MGCKYTSADPDSIVRGGPTLTTCFFNRWGQGDSNTTISMPIMARKRNAGVLIMA